MKTDLNARNAGIISLSQLSFPDESCAVIKCVPVLLVCYTVLAAASGVHFEPLRDNDSLNITQFVGTPPHWRLYRPIKIY